MNENRFKKFTSRIDIFLNKNIVHKLAMYQAKALLWTRIKYLVPGTGKSFSEALILATTNPQYEKR